MGFSFLTFKFDFNLNRVLKYFNFLYVTKWHVLKGGVEWWSGVFKTPSWSVVYDFSVDI
jgi:hypothetical protein